MYSLLKKQGLRADESLVRATILFIGDLLPIVRIQCADEVASIREENLRRKPVGGVPPADYVACIKLLVLLVEGAKLAADFYTWLKKRLSKSRGQSERLAERLLRDKTATELIVKESREVKVCVRRLNAKSRRKRSPSGGGARAKKKTAAKTHRTT